MSIELPKDKHREAIASIVRYFQEQREEEIGNIAATELLRFFLEELVPVSTTKPWPTFSNGCKCTYRI